MVHVKFRLLFINSGMSSEKCGCCCCHSQSKTTENDSSLKDKDDHKVKSKWDTKEVYIATVLGLTVGTLLGFFGCINMLESAIRRY